MPRSPKKKQTSKSKRAGLQFPVGRIARYIRNGNYATRVGGLAPVFLGAVLEYLTAELLELSGMFANYFLFHIFLQIRVVCKLFFIGNAARESKKLRIIPRHILLAIKNDEEFSTLLSNVHITGGGVLPNVHPNLTQSIIANKKDRVYVPAILPKNGGK